MRLTCKGFELQRHNRFDPGARVAIDLEVFFTDEEAAQLYETPGVTAVALKRHLKRRGDLHCMEYGHWMLFGANLNALGRKVFTILHEMDSAGLTEWEGPLPQRGAATPALEALRQDLRKRCD